RSKVASRGRSQHRRSRAASSCRKTVSLTDEASIPMILRPICGLYPDPEFYAALQKLVCLAAANHLTAAVNGGGLPTDGAILTLPVSVSTLRATMPPELVLRDRFEAAFSCAGQG